MTSRSTQGYIGPNLVVHGRMSGQGELKIDGRLEGDLALEGTVEVGSTGVVQAAVDVTVLAVGGHLRGNVVAVDEVRIHEGGRLEGDVRAPRVCIDDGGELHGGIEMDFDLPIDLTDDPAVGGAPEEDAVR